MVLQLFNEHYMVRQTLEKLDIIMIKTYPIQ